MSVCEDLGPINVSPTDDRKYRAIRLENGFQALLIHDATTDKAAAALDVHVGPYYLLQIAMMLFFLEMVGLVSSVPEKQTTM